MLSGGSRISLESEADGSVLQLCLAESRGAHGARIDWQAAPPPRAMRKPNARFSRFVSAESPSPTS